MKWTLSHSFLGIPPEYAREISHTPSLLLQAMEAVASNVGVDASELSTVERKRRRSGSGDVRPVRREMLRGVRRGPGLGPGLQTPAAVTTPAADVQNNLEQKMMQEMDSESEQVQ